MSADIEDIEIVERHPIGSKVADLYDDNPAFANALNAMFPGFEYPDFSHLSIGDVLRKYHSNEAKAISEQLQKDILLTLSKYHDGTVRPAGTDVELEASQAIEDRSLRHSSAVTSAKAAKMVGVEGISERLEAMRNLKVDVISAESARLWARIDIRDFEKLSQSPLRKAHAAQHIYENMSLVSEYKKVLSEEAPEFTAQIEALESEDRKKIAAKDERKIADAAELNCSRLPEMCFVFIETAKPGEYVRAIQNGQHGHFGTTYDEMDPKSAEALVSFMNKKLGVSDIQVECMLAGSMFGWHVPAANPELANKDWDLEEEEHASCRP